MSSIDRYKKAASMMRLGMILLLAGICGLLVVHSLQLSNSFYLLSLVGIITGFFIMGKCYRMLLFVMASIQETKDHALHCDVVDELIATAQQVNGVIMIEDVTERRYGHEVFVDVRISVNPNVSVSEGYDIARSVKNELMTRFTYVTDVFVHIQPFDASPYKNTIKSQNEIGFPNILH